MVDASCGGTFMHKSEDEAWQLFESLSENSLHHLSSRIESSAMGTQKKGGIYEVSQFETIKAKVDILSQKLDKVLTIGTLPKQSTQNSMAQEACIKLTTCRDIRKTIPFLNRTDMPPKTDHNLTKVLFKPTKEVGPNMHNLIPSKGPATLGT
ncbi:hypothetical protein CFOL_v3_10246 [Cephalotus follicularis]|uniref:Uncharacterized protein n=1 Tax=Cephalotus follicularis TaxID=3775 RepID=A0A1Q3BFD5_CEPFO|nr:hypothetical protein CFOL_v3_10246 [Cephalotus follicularis]